MVEPCNDREKKKMVVKIGGGGGGGIGAVILFGGALATAALASAFIYNGKRGRNNPRHKIPSSGATGEVEIEKDAVLSVTAQTLILEENPGIEINGGTPGEQNHCSVNSQKQENDTDGSVIVEEKFNSFEPKSMMHEVKTELNGEDVTNVISKEKDYVKEICIDKEFKDEEYNVDGKIEGISHEEAVNVTKVQSRMGNAIDECCDQEENELTVVDKALENDHIDEMEAKMNLQMKLFMDVKELEAIQSDTEEIGEVKCEKAIEKNKLDVAAVGGGEVKVMNLMEGAKVVDVPPREEETTVKCSYPEETEVTVTENGVKGVPIDQVDAEENSSTEVNNEKKQLERWSDDEETGEVNCREAVEETKVDVADVGFELSEEGTFGNQEAINGEISASETVQDGQETVHPVVESPVIEHRNINGDEEEEFMSSEVAEKTKEGISGNEEAIFNNGAFAGTMVSDSHRQETPPPVCDSALIEHENIEDSKEGALPCQSFEIMQEHEITEITEGGQDEQVKHIEEQSVNEQKDWNLTDEVVPAKCEEVELRGEANQSFRQSDQQIEVRMEKATCGDKEEDACINNPTPHFGDNEKNVQVLAEPMLAEEPISPENIEVTEEDAANEEVVKSLEVNENETLTPLVVCHQKDNNNDAEETEDLPEMIEINIAKAAGDMSMEMNEDEENAEEDDTKDYDSGTDLSDEIEESSMGTGDSSMESNLEAVWPAELLQDPSVEPQQAKPIDQVMDGKIHENTQVKEEDDPLDGQITSGDSFYQAAEGDLQKSTESSTITADSKGNSKKTSFEKYRVEMTSLKNHMKNLTGTRMLIATLSVVTSLSCSWFFELSFVKLCLIVFFTMVLSQIRGY